MGRRAAEWAVREGLGLPVAAQGVLVRIAWAANEGDGWVVPWSHGRMRAETGLSERTLKRHLATLAGAGLIVRGRGQIRLAYGAKFAPSEMAYGAKFDPSEVPDSPRGKESPFGRDSLIREERTYVRNSPSLPKANRADSDRRDWQRLWGPVEGYLRTQVVPESFSRYYAGIELRSVTARELVLAIPPELLYRYDSDEAFCAEALEDLVDHAGTGLRRGRRIRIVLLEAAE